MNHPAQLLRLSGRTDAAFQPVPQGVSKSAVWEESDNTYGDQWLSKSDVWVEREDFYGEQDSKEAFLLIGFDTEFKSPSHPLSRAEINEGKGKYEVISYQVFCKVIDPDLDEAVEWGGVCYPMPGQRLSIAEVLTFAVWLGIDSKTVRSVPSKITLAGHFTRADIPAFRDFDKLVVGLDAVRNTFITLRDSMKVPLALGAGGEVELGITIRDTILLTPASSKSLRALGELVGVDKIVLDEDPAQELWLKQNMDVLLDQDPELFEEYALTDAIICVRYIEILLKLTKDLLGKSTLPITLSGIGVDLLMQCWEDDQGLDTLDLLGKERVKQKVFDKRRGHYITKKVTINQEAVDLHLTLATEAYHGGRNEQFWFGPGFVDEWTDHDLSGAYPTAMAMIKTPNWSAAQVTLNVADFTPESLGVARVEFEFPPTTRFPSLPVRTDNGLVFPLKGSSYCGSPEIAVAKALGAKLNITHGVIIPYRDDTLIFGEFIRQCVTKRRAEAKKTLLEYFWKEISNSSYGKTAQGLREKRVFSLKEMGTVELKESRITNAFFAAYITSFVRATLGEILNRLPDHVCVFSCTTDGFLTNSSGSEMVEAQAGPLCKLYEKSRFALTGVLEVLETKHTIKQPLGWRTRGQATLLEGQSNQGDDHNIVLAKGGIFSPPGIDTTRQRNDQIVDLFLNRTPESIIHVESMTGIRDIVERHNDLVFKETTKRLSMEYDWKRRPHSVVDASGPDHVAFSTTPWETVQEFQAIRDYWDHFRTDNPICIKTVRDFKAFADYVFTHSSLRPQDARYLRKVDPDIRRLRQTLCGAWAHSRAGLTKFQFGWTNADFAALLTDAGIKCSRANVENGGRSSYEPHRCPPTSLVLATLRTLSAVLPTLDAGDLIADTATAFDLTAAVGTYCPHTSRLTEP